MIALYQNQFTRQVPTNLGKLHGLHYLSFFSNQLGSTSGDDLTFITSLTNRSCLQYLSVSNNSLTGTIPNLSTKISYLTLYSNQIYGSIPVGIGNLVNLIKISFADNHLTGQIPEVMLMLPEIGELFLEGNQLSGRIPYSFNTSTPLHRLDLSGNKFSGRIPPSLRNCQHLEALYFENNNLQGKIPKQVFLCLTMLVEIDLSHNALTGSLPSEVGNLINLMVMDISFNRMSGEIPNTIGNYLSLGWLLMANNFFNGTIPDLLSTLRGIQYLDLSHNNLFGEIPKYLGNFSSLKYLNLSYNDLEAVADLVHDQGEAKREKHEQIFQRKIEFTDSKLLSKNYEGKAKGKRGLTKLSDLDSIRVSVLKMTDSVCTHEPEIGFLSVISLVGNTKLCGGAVGLNLKPCPIFHKKGKSLTFEVIIPVIVVSLSLLLISCLLFTFFRGRKSEKKFFPKSLLNPQYTRISFAELLRATNNFSVDNLIRIGSFGSVYKGTLRPDNRTVAVKVLKLQQRGASKSFLSECSVLRNIRHRNLLKIITCCSSVDFQGNDFKALVFEFMAKGSLEEWLHPKGDEHHQLSKLNFFQRLNIAIDIASALDYLHNHCQPAVVHCDVKPSNVLLDNDMTAHVSDFGLAKIFSAPWDVSSQSQSSSLALKGSIGYVPPEYGTGGEVSMKGDVYSYGILLLEMFTGKRPTDDIFQDGHNLRNFAEMALPEQVMHIVDPTMSFERSDEVIQNHSHHDTHVRMHECLVSAIQLGVVCSVESPFERINIGEVLVELYHIKDHFHGSMIHLE